MTAGVDGTRVKGGDSFAVGLGLLREHVLAAGAASHACRRGRACERILPTVVPDIRRGDSRDGKRGRGG